MSCWLNDWQWFDFAELGSTNDYAATQSLSFNSSSKMIYSAKMQTKGRGRRGRSWVSPLGNLYFSQLFFSRRTPVELVYITALSIVDAIRFFSSDLPLQIKWPNDILIDGQKVGGILIEKMQNEAYVIGIGINLVSAPQNGVIYPVASLTDYQVKASRKDFIKQYLFAFETNIQKSFDEIITDFLPNAYKLNQEIIINNNNEKVSGKFIGIDEQGFLLLKSKNNIITINTGEILFS